MVLEPILLQLPPTFAVAEKAGLIRASESTATKRARKIRTRTNYHRSESNCELPVAKKSLHFTSPYCLPCVYGHSLPLSLHHASPMEQFPSMKSAEFRRLVMRSPLNYRILRTRGSHQLLTVAGRGTILIATHEGRTMSPRMVEKLLTQNAGLTRKDALKLVKGEKW